MLVSYAHWFDPSPTGEGTGTQCRVCFGWRDDFRHLYGEPPNLAAYAVAVQPGVGALTLQGKRRQGPKVRTRPARRAAQLGAPAPASALSAQARERARQVLARLAEEASRPSPTESRSAVPQAETSQESALVF